MSARQSELTVIVKAKDLAGYVLTVTDKSPKRFRFMDWLHLMGQFHEGLDGVGQYPPHPVQFFEASPGCVGG
ncbi:MAG: hypothetical protein IJ087_07655 [Eggerthellaceae bacterium]|nr:hypothetical protein [Eggerthellaceae bacterium]